MADMTLPVRLKIDAQPIILVVTPTVAQILDAVALAYKPFSLVPGITSGLEGKHKRKSEHYNNAAVDFRISDIPLQYRDDMLRKLKEILPITYSYILESDHLHVDGPPVLSP